MEFILKNIKPSDYIALASLLVSIFAFYMSGKNTKLNSYSQNGVYSIILLNRKLSINKSLCVKIFDSATSDTLPFDYKLVVHSQVGGIYRAIVFNILDERNPIGMSKTIPTTNKRMLGFHPFKKYAYNTNIYFDSTPLFPYASAYVLNDDSKNNFMISRYHFYIEITDYCNNTEIWYVAFSLLLSNEKKCDFEWKPCHIRYGYKYYTYDDICVVSPKDIIRNLDRINTFNKSLNDIIDKDEHTGNSKSLMNKGYMKTNSELQLYEMKEYHKFIKELKNEKIIIE